VEPGHIICFKCRKPVDTSIGYCVHCSSAVAGNDDDPEVVLTERRFLLARGVELTDLESPLFMGFEVEELEWKSERVPALSVGGPKSGIDSKQPRETLLSKLSVGQGWERALAAIQLASYREPDIVLALLKRLGDRDSDVRVSVLWALGRNGNPLVVAPLLEFEKIEKDELAKRQLAATLYRIITRGTDRKRDISEKLRSELEKVEMSLLAGPQPELFLRRGKLRIRAGSLLRAIGDFSRCVDTRGMPTPEALVHRSQGFLLMGKPLFALDDLVICPDDYEYPPIYYLHRLALTTLTRQLVATARQRGLMDYARLFERRLKLLEKKKKKKKKQ